MKKTLIILPAAVAFIVGIVLSDLILEGFNRVFQKEIFTTRAGLAQKLEKCKEKHTAATEEKRRRQQNLENLVKDMNDKDYFNLTKETMLAAAPSPGDTPGKIFLKPPANEMLFKETSADDATIRALKETFNKKISAVVEASKGILKEKIGQLNLELMDMNYRLREKNLELEENLRELEEYKEELGKHKKYISELEDIRLDLQKTVGNLETKIEEGRLRVNFKGDILFASGSHQLKKEGIQLLESVFPVLNGGADKYDILIAGHTDNVPIKPEFRHKYASNWELSTYRAIEVVKYLTVKGMNPRSLTAAGYGEFKPISDNDTAVGKARNRRVELFLIPKIIKR
jgi:flagellar motor protein MotB